MMNDTFVSIVVLSYKRRDAVVKVLDSCIVQDYSAKEIIVVDNGSEDGTAEFLKENYPEVKTIALPENIGCAGRNKGMAAARGDIVVTIDNDVSFDSPDELKHIVSVFERYPDAACVNFKIYNPFSGGLNSRDWCHPREQNEYAEKEFETLFISEGACAFRKGVIDVVGGYYEPLFIGCEGYDLALRMIDKGYIIMYSPQVLVWHSMSLETRETWRPYYFYTRNYFWIAFKDYSFLPGLRFIIFKLAMMFYFSVKTRFVKFFFKGVFDGIINFPKINAEKTRMKKETVIKIKQLNAFRPSLLLRFRKHLAKPQI